MAYEADSDWNSAPQREDNEDENRYAEAIKKARQAQDLVNKTKSAVNTAKKIGSTIDKAKTAIQASRAAVVLANPWVLAIIAAIIGLILIYFFFFSDTSSNDDATSPPPPPSVSTNGGTATPLVPGFTFNITVDPPCSPIEPGFDSCVQNGQDITYTVSYTYDVSVGKVPLINLVIVDSVPLSAHYVSTTGVQGADSVPTLLTFPLEDPVNQKSFTIVLHPMADDVSLTNSISVKPISKTGSSSSSPSPQEFKDLITGQGRNVAILGDKNSFISTVIKNSSGLSLSGKEDYLSKIYDAGVQYTVNPLILTVIWGVEFGFDPSADYPFGCLNQSDQGFTENVTCAAGSLNQLMAKFETQNIAGSLEIPSSTGNTCIYTDAFDYAYELYTPVCHANDGNDSSRSNFTAFYQKLKGL